MMNSRCEQVTMQVAGCGGAMADVFLSYASEDRDRVATLAQTLEQLGFSVWWDHAIRVGTRFDNEIDKAIRDAACVLVVWSRAWTESEWVRDEASEGLRRDILVPMQIDDCQLPLGFKRIQTARIARDGSLPPHIYDAIQRLTGKPPHGSNLSA